MPKSYQFTVQVKGTIEVVAQNEQEALEKAQDIVIPDDADLEVIDRTECEPLGGDKIDD